MNAIEIITSQYRLNTHLFNNVLSGIGEEDGTHRLTGQVNHLRWIAGHLVGGRYRNGIRVGLPMEEYPYADQYILKNVPPPNARPIDESIEYPKLAESLKQWNEISPIYTDGIAALSEEQLLADGPFVTPLGGKTFLDVLAFVAGHEAHHIGQMSIIRKSLGYPAMSYK